MRNANTSSSILALNQLLQKRLLYLEDHAPTREAWVSLLEREGFQVFSYGSAEEAAGHLRQGDVDIALLDVGLPGRLGDDFGHEIEEKFPLIRIVFLTGEVDIQKIKFAVPGSIIISKPADPFAVLKVLKNIDTANYTN